MPEPRLDRSLGTPPPVPPEAAELARTLIESGYLHRYGETNGLGGDVAALEAEFAESIGAPYCIAMNSCGAAMAIALRAAGIGLGDHVLVNVFTLSPVPGAVDHVGATPVIVGIGADYTVDRDHLATSAKQSGATTLLLSHMRGHMAPMDDIVELCDELRLTLIEDRAHTMGAAWGTHRRADSVWLAASQPSRTNTSIAVRAACW